MRRNVFHQDSRSEPKILSYERLEEKIVDRETIFSNHNRLFEYMSESYSSNIFYQEKGFLDRSNSVRYFYLKFSGETSKGILCITNSKGWEFYEANENLRLKQFFRGREAFEIAQISFASNRIDIDVNSTALCTKGYPLYLYEFDILDYLKAL